MSPSHVCKAFWSQSMTPQTTIDNNGSLRGCCRSVHASMGCDQEGYTLVWGWHQLPSGSLPNGRLSKFQVICRLGRELFTLPVCCRRCPWSHGLWPKKLILIVWWWHQLLSDFLPNGRLSLVSHRLVRELFTLPLQRPVKVHFKLIYIWLVYFTHNWIF